MVQAYGYRDAKMWTDAHETNAPPMFPADAIDAYTSNKAMDLHNNAVGLSYAFKDPADGTSPAAWVKARESSLRVTRGACSS